MSDLVEAVLAACARTPDAPAITTPRGTWTYRELENRIRSIASALRANGFAPGDRVMFSVRPGPDAVALALGIVGASGTVVFADPGAGEALFRARAGLAAPRWVAAESLLYLASTLPLRPIARRRGLELAPYATLVPEARHIRAGRWLPGVPRGAFALDTLATTPRRPDDAGVIPGHPDDLALVVFTSGTTAVPKAVAHTRGSLGSGLTDFSDGVGIRQGLRVLTDQLMVGIPALIGGAHWTMPAPGLDPGASPEAYLDHLGDAEMLFASPAALDVILRALDERPELTPKLDTIVLGGAPVLAPLLRRIRERMPSTRVRAVYGMTEILPVAIADGAEKLAAIDAAASRGDAPAGDRVGRIMPSVTARIVDGELVLSGRGLARGYLAELPEHPLTELRTGDLADIDGDHLVLRGRAKDMFIRGTQNVYPGLYEPLIAGLPGVGDAAMAGVPDVIGDDRLVVALVAADAATAPAAPTAEHPLAASVARKLPGLIDAGVMPDLVVVVPGLPRAGRGRKLDRTALRTMVAPLILGEHT